MRYLIFIMLFMGQSFAYNMRNCLLLPVTGNTGGAFSYRVFEDIEKYLKADSWCRYSSNSDILDILKGHRRNLDKYLDNQAVLKIMADKTKSGSLIRINVLSKKETIEISLDVVANNGIDLYFHEKIKLLKNKTPLIMGTLKNWLEEYSKLIPYDGIVIGVIGQQFTVDAGKEHNARYNSFVNILRPSEKKIHPLLKSIVSWEGKKFADGKLIQSSYRQSLGKVEEYYSPLKIREGDWIKFKTKAVTEDVSYTAESKMNKGKLGIAKLGPLLGQSKVNIGGTKIAKGFHLGTFFSGELWFTRDLWGGLDFTLSSGGLEKDTGTFTKTNPTLDYFSWKLLFGYKYLPLGFFYGPSLDAVIGIAKHTLTYDDSAADSLTTYSYSGPLLGLRSDLPIRRDFRVKAEVEFIISPSYSEELSINGTEESSMAFEFKVGPHYSINSRMGVLAFFEWKSFSTKYKAGHKIKHHQSSFKALMSYNF